jgi:hypothetical protein
MVVERSVLDIIDVLVQLLSICHIDTKLFQEQLAQVDVCYLCITADIVDLSNFALG